MSIKRFIQFIILVVLSGFLGACASVPMAPSTQDQEAKQFREDAEKANVYIFRDETFGSAIKMSVLLDGKILGRTASRTYFRVKVDPGSHTILSLSENEQSLEINVEQGKNYFVWQEVKMGMWAARSKLHLVDAVRGKKGVLSSKLIKMKGSP